MTYPKTRSVILRCPLYRRLYKACCHNLRSQYNLESLLFPTCHSFPKKFKISENLKKNYLEFLLIRTISFQFSFFSLVLFVHAIFIALVTRDFHVTLKFWLFLGNFMNFSLEILAHLGDNFVLFTIDTNMVLVTLVVIRNTFAG